MAAASSASQKKGNTEKKSAQDSASKGAENAQSVDYVQWGVSAILVAVFATALVRVILSLRGQAVVPETNNLLLPKSLPDEVPGKSARHPYLFDMRPVHTYAVVVNAYKEPYNILMEAMSSALTSMVHCATNVSSLGKPACDKISGHLLLVHDGPPPLPPSAPSAPGDSHALAVEAHLAKHRAVSSAVLAALYETAGVNASYLSDLRITVEAPIQFATNRGRSTARNAGASTLPQADTLFYLDGDDVYFPPHISKGVAALRSDPGLCYHRGLIQPLDLPPAHPAIHPTWVPRLSHTIPCALAIRRWCLDFAGGWRPKDHVYEDVYLMDVLSQLFPIKLDDVSPPTSGYRWKAGSHFDRQLAVFVLPDDEGDRLANMVRPPEPDGNSTGSSVPEIPIKDPAIRWAERSIFDQAAYFRRHLERKAVDASDPPPGPDEYPPPVVRAPWHPKEDPWPFGVMPYAGAARGDPSELERSARMGLPRDGAATTTGAGASQVITTPSPSSQTIPRPRAIGVVGVTPGTFGATGFKVFPKWPKGWQSMVRTAAPAASTKPIPSKAASGSTPAGGSVATKSKSGGIDDSNSGAVNPGCRRGCVWVQEWEYDDVELIVYLCGQQPTRPSPYRATGVGARFVYLCPEHVGNRFHWVNLDAFDLVATQSPASHIPHVAVFSDPAALWVPPAVAGGRSGASRNAWTAIHRARPNAVLAVVWNQGQPWYRNESDWDKNDLVSELAQHIPIDVVVRSGSDNEVVYFTEDGTPVESLDSYYSRYKFVLALEDIRADDLVTERLFWPLLRGAVPVYVGAPNVREYLPHADAAVVVSEFTGMKALAAHLERACRDADMYAKHHRWRLEEEPVRKLHEMMVTKGFLLGGGGFMEAGKASAKRPQTWVPSGNVSVTDVGLRDAGSRPRHRLLSAQNRKHVPRDITMSAMGKEDLWYNPCLLCDYELPDGEMGGSATKPLAA
eukprot:jgi/Mesvir1/21750/Mv04156-RA.2